MSLLEGKGMDIYQVLEMVVRFSLILKLQLIVSLKLELTLSEA